MPRLARVGAVRLARGFLALIIGSAAVRVLVQQLSTFLTCFAASRFKLALLVSINAVVKMFWQ